ncbi:endonuclease/exonuclease/phosphatase [Fischerella thermalis]|uniref:Endonuclease/exonuclease/phosphatase n=1 Tax=Fischerella thermalis JSC-11 TaxID=741277 RepID=G6G045_9CYAN|nr:endonuclease/exonuclease/phosphatase [Fischerella thermalis]EHC08503.1 Endonuclease/exonuclease/phosphatase [Fischerella thermalis JSC-11]PLZ08591.1 endonuclease/exonuclease/phosphatase [Fischerella thermalis WC119]PLZ14605.1 endonuclease/exonuclease/phosphatase [Fischerella thermalis WC114]PLZ14971.1 endonuclease/exonuclease/phosphatase [Fischerella thermalis WC1110]PLZ20610.1 endonuclease/exonuclease/phosphatase [Fischerella thermalis WC341]
MSLCLSGSKINFLHHQDTKTQRKLAEKLSLLSITQIGGNPSITVLSNGNSLPTATILGNGGRTIPTTVIANDATGEDKLTVATFNVENLDPGDGSGKFTSLANAIVNNLKSPDIISLEEVQDNNGATNDSVVDGNLTYQTLIDAIAAAGGPTYEYRQINPVDDQDGGEPGGNIRVGFLFNPNRVDFVDRPGGTSASDRIQGFEKNDTISGLGGNDILEGDAGNDKLYGEAGNDRIYAGQGNDQIYGGNGDDVIYAEAGNNKIDSGSGFDTVFSGSGRDTFVLAAGEGFDLIENFAFRQDRIELSGLRFADLTITQGTGADANNTLISVTSTGDLLASLIGVQVNTVTSSVFTIV